MASDEKTKNGYDYDFFVIGGGSGGLACVKEAAKYNVKCAVADFVKPSPAGSIWGLGGTCLNVGCIPKKLMHFGATMGEDIKSSENFGWKVDNVSHDWATLVENIGDYISASSFGHRSECMKAGIKYYNELAHFVDPHTVECVDKRGRKTLRTAEKFLVSVGGRPRYPDTPGAKECITSDDIFSLDHSPGKTLVVGASYIALECAGFLHAFGYDTTVMVRSILLRGFDQQIAEMVGKTMEKEGIKFINKCVPTSFEKTSESKTKVTYEGGSDEYDTVLLAIGRYPDLEQINLSAVGVHVNPKSGKILTKQEQTNIEHIYAIGDCIDGVPELTPSAIQAGRLLARRLFNNEKTQMDYDNIATTVFTPIEYGVVGLSEEVALERYGEKDIEVYHVHWKPLQWCLDTEREGSFPYCKIICVKSENEKVVGLHYLGPNAGEVTQGFGVAVKLGVTYEQLVDTVGIHPTDAEQLVGLRITKNSGDSPAPPGC